MATIKCINSKASLKKAVDYIQNKEKGSLGFAKDCNTKRATQQMMMIKNLWDKKDGRAYKHFTVSFHQDEKITEREVAEFTMELINRSDMFEDFQVVGAVHNDRDHLHSHFIVNSVSYVDGHKFHQSKKDLQNLKNLCDEICNEKGLTITEKGKTFEQTEREELSAYSKETYRMLKKAEEGKVDSYVTNIALEVLTAKEQATSKDEFVEMLLERGIKTDWKENRKYITFTDIEREKQGLQKCKVRHNRLEQYFNMEFGKEELENEFKRNASKEIATREEERREREFESFIADARNERRATTSVITDSAIEISQSTIERGRREERRRDQQAERREQDAARADREELQKRLDEEREREERERAERREKLLRKAREEAEYERASSKGYEPEL